MRRPFLAAWALPIAVATPLAWAQAVSSNPKSDPHDANAPVPAVTYQSPFAGYRVLSEEKITPWKETNGNVGAIGVWRVYAKEALEPASAGKPAQGPENKPVPLNGAKPTEGGQSMPPKNMPMSNIEVQIRKPTGHFEH